MLLTKIIVIRQSWKGQEISCQYKLTVQTLKEIKIHWLKASLLTQATKALLIVVPILSKTNSISWLEIHCWKYLSRVTSKWSKTQGTSSVSVRSFLHRKLIQLQLSRTIMTWEMFCQKIQSSLANECKLHKESYSTFQNLCAKQTKSIRMNSASLTQTLFQLLLKKEKLNGKRLDLKRRCKSYRPCFQSKPFLTRLITHLISALSLSFQSHWHCGRIDVRVSWSRSLTRLRLHTHTL